MGWVQSAKMLPTTEIIERQARLNMEFQVQIYYYYYYYFAYTGPSGYPIYTPQRVWWGGPGYGHVSEMIFNLTKGGNYHATGWVIGRDGSFKQGGFVYWKQENPPEIWHFRAYGIAGDGNLYRGEDMEFEWPV